jgi:2-polyprenyl-6-hydroxyphenyl methylase/3-demethylubiquinone-9 3-methyltransferase
LVLQKEAVPERKALSADLRRAACPSGGKRVMAEKAARNVDRTELAKFEAAASGWWSAGKAFQALHDINPLRLAFIRQRVDLVGRAVVDVGCGGGILTETLAAAGAKVTGIDLGPAALTAAEAHRQASGLAIAYRHIDAETLADQNPAAFDIVVCMELLEHVPDPSSIVQACARLVRPEGHLFFATLNRTPAAYVLAILMAERVLRIVPNGTHQYERFITPRELSGWARSSGLRRGDFSGMLYVPFLRRAFLIRNTAVNYLAHFRREHHSDIRPLTRPPESSIVNNF